MYDFVGDLVFDPRLINATTERRVPVAVRTRSMSYLRGRARDHLSDHLRTGQNTKVFYRGVSVRTVSERIARVTPLGVFSVK